MRSYLLTYSKLKKREPLVTGLFTNADTKFLRLWYHHLTDATVCNLLQMVLYVHRDLKDY